jgi:hypothetical protein
VSKIEANATVSETLKELVMDPELDLTFSFASIPGIIPELESRSKSVEEQLSILRAFRSASDVRFAERLDEVLKKTLDFERLSKIPEKDLEMYKFVVLSNAEVERSFSLYKNLLSDHRKSLSENLERHLPIRFNSELLFEE